MIEGLTINELAEKNALLVSEVSALQQKLDALAAENAVLKSVFDSVTNLENEPEYHYQGMGCGLEDRGIIDRYEAMKYGWDEAMERIYGEVIPSAEEVLFPATDAYLKSVRADSWADALLMVKSAIFTDSLDHLDFLFNGKIEQLRSGTHDTSIKAA